MNAQVKEVKHLIIIIINYYISPVCCTESLIQCFLSYCDTMDKKSKRLKKKFTNQAIHISIVFLHYVFGNSSRLFPSICECLK